MINFYNKLKLKFNITSDRQMLFILLTFAFTGSTIAFAYKPLLFSIIEVNENTPLWLKIFYWLVFVFPAYYILLIGFGSIFGQYNFFKNWILKKGKKKNS